MFALFVKPWHAEDLQIGYAGTIVTAVSGLEGVAVGQARRGSGSHRALQAAVRAFLSRMIFDSFFSWAICAPTLSRRPNHLLGRRLICTGLVFLVPVGADWL